MSKKQASYFLILVLIKLKIVMIVFLLICQLGVEIISKELLFQLSGLQ